MNKIPNTNEIKMFFHCAKCMPQLPKGQSPAQWSRLDCGWTTLGFQVWCRRCNVNIVHIDFQGCKHPANAEISYDQRN